MTQKTRQIQTGLNRGDILTVSTFNRIDTIITFGIFVVIVLNMLTRTRKTVINRVILDRKRKYIISYFLKPYTFTYLSFSLYQSIFKSHFICKFLIGETHNSITHSLTMTRKTVINRVILDRS